MAPAVELGRVEQQDRQAYDLALLQRTQQLPIPQPRKVVEIASEALDEQAERQAHDLALLKGLRCPPQPSKRIASQSVGMPNQKTPPVTSRAASVRRALVGGARTPRRGGLSSSCAKMLDLHYFPEAQTSFRSSQPLSLQGANPMAMSWKPIMSALDTPLEQEEAGAWQYLVVDPRNLLQRDSLDEYCESAPDCTPLKCAPDLEMGQVVTVYRRRRQGWVNWLAVKDFTSDRRPCLAWFGDVSPDSDRTQHLVEVEVQTGSWAYEAISEQAVIHPRPATHTCSGSTSNRPLHCLGHGEVVLVTERIQPFDDERAFLKLGDGRGWVSDYVNGNRLLQATSKVAREAVENGEWSYIVVDPKGICPRNEATYDKAAKIKRRIEEGEVLRVTQRKVADGTAFLKIGSPAGWVFDVQPGDQSRIRMRMVSVEQGMWSYQVQAERGVALRMRCSFSDSAKAGHGPNKGDIVRVKERVRCGENTFLRLADGSGWVFDRKQGRQMLDLVGPKDTLESPKSYSVLLGIDDHHSSRTTQAPSQGVDCAEPPAECGDWHYIVLDQKGIRPRNEASYDKGKKLKHRIEEGEVVHVTERKPGEGTVFLKLNSPAGWVFDTQPSNLAKVRMREVNVERGRWLYVVVAEKGVALRTRCSFSDAAKASARGPEKGAVIEVKERVRCGATSFLRLVDGSGWVFDVKNGQRVLDQLGPKEAVEMSAAGRVLAQSSAEMSPKKKANCIFFIEFLTAHQLTNSTLRGEGSQ